MNREQWLNAFADAARRPFVELAETEIPDNIRISIGFPKGKRAIGQCFNHSASGDGTFEIFIHPKEADSARVADILTHELIHAAVGFDARHGKRFSRVARKVGLTGKMTSTVAGEAWHEWADPVLADLGPIPHASLSGGLTDAPKEQKNRQLKAECSCGMIFRASRKRLLEAIDQGGVRCPVYGCEGVVTCEGLDDPNDGDEDGDED